jgi:hypothetical protein
MPDLGARAMLLFRWLLNIGLAILAIYLIIKYRALLAEYWGQFLAAIRDFWARLFGGGRAAGQEDAAVAAAPAPRHPFAAYANPFFNGQAAKASGNELVVYSFDALQAWADEAGLGRSPDATPLEFADQLGTHVPDLAGEARELAQNFSRVAYGGERLPREQVAPGLGRLWLRLSAPRPVAAEA